MKYDIRLKIQLKEEKDKYHKYFIEVEKEFELPFHPNITDKIYIEEAYWKILEISWDIDQNKGEIHLYEQCSGRCANDSENKNRITLTEEYIKYYKPYKWCLIDYYLGKEHISMNDVELEIERKKNLSTKEEPK